MSLNIEDSKSSSGRIEVSLIGRLDSETAPTLDAHLEEVLQHGPKGLVLDIEELAYLSSAGIRTLFTVQRKMLELGENLWVLSPQPAVRKVLETVRILAPGTLVSERSQIDAAAE